MEVGVLAAELKRLVPDETVDAEFLQARNERVSQCSLAPSCRKMVWEKLTGSQWNLVKQRLPSLLMRQNVLTPKPFIMRNERGMPRSDMAHMSVCIVSGARPKKSQALSCAVWAWGISLCGSGLTLRYGGGKQVSAPLRYMGGKGRDGLRTSGSGQGT